MLPCDAAHDPAYGHLSHTIGAGQFGLADCAFRVTKTDFPNLSFSKFGVLADLAPDVTGGLWGALKGVLPRMTLKDVSDHAVGYSKFQGQCSFRPRASTVQLLHFKHLFLHEFSGQPPMLGCMAHVVSDREVFQVHSPVVHSVEILVIDRKVRRPQKRFSNQTVSQASRPPAKVRQRDVQVPVWSSVRVERSAIAVAEPTQRGHDVVGEVRNRFPDFRGCGHG